jgi:stearoyl-CoA desaturase (delta-9 desaturase)
MRDDPGFIFIRLLTALGLAWDVKIPCEEKIARRLAHQASQGALDLEHG